jgi:hypothetical protein
MDFPMNHNDKRYEKACRVGLVFGTLLNATLALWMHQAPWVAGEFRLAFLTALSELTRF